MEKGQYARIEIPLDVAETGKELYLTGDYLSICSITGSGTCKIRLNHRHSQEIDLREVSGITGAFKRIYLTTDGDGGTCTIYIGLGMAIQVSPDPQKLWNGGSASTQATTLTASVLCLASEPFKLRDVTFLNSNGVYACYIGPYNANVATFKAYAYVLLPHKTLHFSMVDMYSLGIISYDGSNNVIVDVIGVYE